MGVIAAKTAVEKALYSFDKPFDYIVPDYLTDKISVGSRVLVPFGKGNKKSQAIVTHLYELDSPGANLKYIAAAPDDYPLLTAELTSLSEILSKRCYCTRYDVVKAMLPVGINYKISCVYTLSSPKYDIELSEEQSALLKLMPPFGKDISRDKLFKLMGTDCETRPLCELIGSGVIIKKEKAFRRVRDASETMLVPLELPEDVVLTPRQREVYDLLNQVGEISEKELCYFTGVSKSVIDTMLAKRACRSYAREVFRIPKSISTPQCTEISLTDEQETAYQKLRTLFDKGEPAVSLLYGITGSGKTSVFMKLMEHASQTDKGIIVMVPEIALTPQLVEQFKTRFGEQVAVFHSGLSMGERLDEWKRVRRGKAKIAVGTRSAVFAPFQKLGLIIMDEEQEYTYKSDKTPRFHARDAAKLRCASQGALLVLSSATPSVESKYLADNGIYQMCTLRKRYGKAVLPNVIVADMNEEKVFGNTTGFSQVLLEKLNQNLINHEQSIILQNRRGFNTAVTCKSCSEAISCPSCSISLTYHADNGRLMCHYCGFSMAIADKCPKCGSADLRFIGSGTQRTEQAIAELFPNARVLRLDADSTLAKQSHEIKLNDFRTGKYDILLGTQMVAKGLDFPNVTLVGVLSADQAMYGEDFRSYERAFSLITQVVGRSGRGEKHGTAVIQTYTPENPLIALASSQNYDSFYNSEIQVRKAMLYPPFSDICMLGITGENEELCRDAAFCLSSELCDILKERFSDLPIRILGPSPATIYRVSKRYRYKIILKFKNSRRFREMLSEVIINFTKQNKFKNIYVYADVDPDNIL